MSNITSFAPIAAAVLTSVLAPITHPLEGRRAQDERNGVTAKAVKASGKRSDVTQADPCRRASRRGPPVYPARIRAKPHTSCQRYCRFLGRDPSCWPDQPPSSRSSVH